MGQDKTVAQGDKHFENYHYRKAIEAYEKVGEPTVAIQKKLADSYRLLGNTGKAEEHYAAVVTDESRDADDLYYYASALKSNGKYVQSDVWMGKFQEVRSADSRVSKYQLQSGQVKKMMEADDRYKIKNLDINSEQEDFGAAYYDDQIVFASSREGVKPVRRTWNWNGLPFLDVYVADKAADGELSNLRGFHKHINDKYHEGPASFTSDGNFMVFTRNNYSGSSEKGVVKLQLFSVYKGSDGWGNPVPLPFNSAEYSVGHPALNAAGDIMYFASDMPGGIGGTDIYRVKRGGDDTWGVPVNLGGKINTEGNEMFPFYHEGGFLLFSSDGHGGLGGLDNFIVKIEGEKTSKVLNMGYPLNDKKDDFAAVLDPAMATGYFSSNRPGGKGDDDLYSFDLLKPFIFGKTLKGVVRDKKGNPLLATKVELLDAEGSVVATAYTGVYGTYSFDVESDKQFKPRGVKDSYFDGRNEVSSKTDDDVIFVDLELEKDPGLSLYCLIVGHGDKTPIAGVKVTLQNNMTGKSEEILTGASGDFRKPLPGKKLNDRISYNLTIEKEGYLSKSATYNTVLDHEGQYDIHKSLNIAMDKIDVGAVLSKIIDIKPIYFDLGKHTMRKDAAVELDKIVKVMNENPKMKVELGSHSDCRGSSKFNMSLSDKRAKASAKYIHDNITDPDRIYGKGYGESVLINKCECEGSKKVPCTDEEHQQNRRTEFKIVDMGQD